MRKQSWWLRAALGVALASVAWCGTFGKAVAIGGHAADLALDEARGVLYVANFTANRVEVLSLQSGTVQTSINVPQQPSSLALSADGRFLVVAHYGNYISASTQTNALTVVDLANSNAKQTYMLGYPPLGVAFGIDNLALVVTTQDFLLFDPLRGTTTVLDTVEGVTAKTLPQPPANFPPQIVAASLGVSWDKLKVYGLTDTIHFSYDVTTKRVISLSYTASPAMGPRVVSVNQDGSMYTAGWGMFNAHGNLVAQFRNPSGQLNVGSHAIDSNRGVVYAQIPETGSTTATGGTTTPPLLMIAASDNLAVRETLRLPENLAGKSVLSSNGATMYAVSDSGVMILPVGSLAASPRLMASQEDVVFQSTFCDRNVMTKDIVINDPSGNGSDFTLSSSTSGVSVSPSSGTAPAAVRITVDPTAFQNTKGTVAATLMISSRKAVNVVTPVRVLVNMHDPDQRGIVVNVPGKLVDLLADPSRDRFFILRQDTNQVLVYDGSSYSQVAALRTGNTPTQMAISFDRRYLFVGNDNSQLANVYDLETLATLAPIYFPGGHYPRSIASSGRAILAACRVAGTKHTIDRVDMFTRTAWELPSLGVYNNDINLNTMMVATGNGSSILAAEADGNLLLYNANVDTFTVSRKDSVGTGRRIRGFQLRSVRGGQHSAERVAGSHPAIRNRQRVAFGIRIHRSDGVPHDGGFLRQSGRDPTRGSRHGRTDPADAHGRSAAARRDRGRVHAHAGALGEPQSDREPDHIGVHRAGLGLRRLGGAARGAEPGERRRRNPTGGSGRPGVHLRAKLKPAQPRHQ